MDVAFKVIQCFVPDTEIPSSDLRRLLQHSYKTFNDPAVAPLVPVRKEPAALCKRATMLTHTLRHPQISDDGSASLLELFHGPTAAFKDVALQFVGNLFEYFLRRRRGHARRGSDSGRDELLPEQSDDDGDDASGDSESDSDTETTPASITVVGATSGDTGSAAIAGLRGKHGVEVFILHPAGRVARVQELQMTTVMDANVHNVAVDAAFDDCQSMVKALFADEEFRKQHHLAAVNSINWARILAQIVYYFTAYFAWVRAGAGTRRLGQPVTFVVPTGNFGDILAGHYAKRMGLPVARLVAATNANDIVHR